MAKSLFETLIDLLKSSISGNKNQIIENVEKAAIDELKKPDQSVDVPVETK